MSYREEDFANMLSGWIGVEGHIGYLAELDPTHVPAPLASLSMNNTPQTAQAYRVPSLPHLFAASAAAPALLELDPTH
ncbi:hypothetical protein [Paucimonas lemoignei]|nr:hypothetical protein [Paucimonas lemoignei]